MHTEDFIKHGIYLKNWSPKTVRTYRQGLNLFQMAIGEQPEAQGPSACAQPTVLTKAHLDTFVIWMRQRGLSPGACNVNIRSVNSYLSWLAEEGHTPQRLRIKLLSNPRQPLRGFSNAEIRLLLAFRPRGLFELRTWTLIQLLLDTGIRIDEALTLRTDKVDMDAMHFTVMAKEVKNVRCPFRWNCANSCFVTNK
jgi:site-specific recombinase XerD